MQENETQTRYPAWRACPYFPFQKPDEGLPHRDYPAKKPNFHTGHAWWLDNPTEPRACHIENSLGPWDRPRS